MPLNILPIDHNRLRALVSEAVIQRDRLDSLKEQMKHKRSALADADRDLSLEQSHGGRNGVIYGRSHSDLQARTLAADTAASTRLAGATLRQKDAAAAFAFAKEAHAEAQAQWESAARLSDSVLSYARASGGLPSDLGGETALRSVN